MNDRAWSGPIVSFQKSSKRRPPIRKTAKNIGGKALVNIEALCAKCAA